MFRPPLLPTSGRCITTDILQEILIPFRSCLRFTLNHACAWPPSAPSPFYIWFQYTGACRSNNINAALFSTYHNWQPCHLRDAIHNFIYQCINNLLHTRFFPFRVVTYYVLDAWNIRYRPELITKILSVFYILIYILNYILLFQSCVAFTCALIKKRFVMYSF